MSILPNIDGMYSSMAQSSPQMRRGMVWCHECGRSEKVDGAQCLRSGWPKCCSYTMSIDSPEERKRLAPAKRGAKR